MPSLGKVVKIGALALVAGAGLVLGKWYHTAAYEPIDPQRGIYGMAGLEVWIDLNAQMPSALRTWGCETLRARERAVLSGQNSLPPYSCQPGFAEMEDVSAYQAMVDANLTQATAGLDPARVDALRTCFDSKLAAAITPDEMAAMNAYDQPVMSKVVIAMSEAARACKAEVAG